MRRLFDITRYRALRRAHRATASEAAGSSVDLGADAPASPVLAVLDVGAVGGSGTFDGSIEGSDDGSTWTNVIKQDANGALSACTFTQVTAAGAQFFSLAPKRFYRAGATTIATFTSVDYNLAIVAKSPQTPTTHAI